MNTPQSLYFDLDLPFMPDTHEVIYVENEYHPEVNHYIQNNYESIKQKFHDKNAVFVYPPKACQQETPEEVVRYMFPQRKSDTPFVSGTLSDDTFKPHLLEGSIDGPALIHYVRMLEDKPKFHFFTYRPLDVESETPLSDQFDHYLDKITFAVGGGRVFFSRVKPKGNDVADFYFRDDDRETLTGKSNQELTEEIRDRVLELRKRGVQLYLLQDLVEEQPTLSRLVIDKDFRILLPDYNNMEIIMPPLPKAVFLLFLKHPEGILFKRLRDYYPELLEIYKQISNRVVESNIVDSIRDITDPTSNSINEKCARIREAFIKQFDSIYAEHYYITGKRGEPKKITLPRELVELQGL